MNAIEKAYQLSAEKHSHLCPRQVLGVRMGVYAGELLGQQFPQQKKEVLAIVETDGCFLDGIVAASGCEVGRRTMRIEDYGKVAATFVLVASGEALRISPKLRIRQSAQEYAPGEPNRWETMQKGYMRMPTCELFDVSPVQLSQPVRDIISRAGVRVNCDICGEEIINEREITQNDQVFCHACVAPAYYAPVNWAFKTTPGRMHESTISGVR